MERTFDSAFVGSGWSNAFIREVGFLIAARKCPNLKQGQRTISFWQMGHCFKMTATSALDRFMLIAFSLGDRILEICVAILPVVIIVGCCPLDPIPLHRFKIRVGNCMFDFGHDVSAFTAVIHAQSLDLRW